MRGRSYGVRPAALSGGDREMAEFLALVPHHDEQAVLRAVELALKSGTVLSRTS